MEVYLKTIRKRMRTTIGTLWIDGVFVCHTLEDTFRNLPAVCPFTPKGQDCKCEQKIKGITAIPGGRYRAKYMMSPRFGRKLLRLIDVPHFIGILFHRGNKPEDTDGCILVGDWTSHTPDVLTNSTAHEKALDDIWKAVSETKPQNSIEIWVTVDRDLDTPLPFEGNLKIAESAVEILNKLKNGTYLK